MGIAGGCVGAGLGFVRGSDVPQVGGGLMSVVAFLVVVACSRLLSWASDSPEDRRRRREAMLDGVS